jgi:hypothetical protein
MTPSKAKFLIPAALLMLLTSGCDWTTLAQGDLQVFQSAGTLKTVVSGHHPAIIALNANEAGVEKLFFNQGEFDFANGAHFRILLKDTKTLLEGNLTDVSCVGLPEMPGDLGQTAKGTSVISYGARECKGIDAKDATVWKTVVQKVEVQISPSNFADIMAIALSLNSLFKINVSLTDHSLYIIRDLVLLNPTSLEGDPVGSFNTPVVEQLKDL